ncbi:MAG: D-3-phosphoglycerate dehydrogenase [Verrucomicrobia subdivision 3 bacterium]|nr:D-3-phosphoglycerate dehydrogenase [Limisphaerales bacterium]MCS1414903.1 D-3-phosphoglycerate dehydrogenase [Limisphaerales bacterium]
MKVMICDPISSKGVEQFRQHSDLDVEVLPDHLDQAALLPIVKDVGAMVVRSETKITKAVMEAAPKLKVVGRAGVGVDNIDVEAATQRGIVVMNTPGGNTVSTAELTFSMLMATARKIPQAHMSIKQGAWNRKAYKGVELYRKTLGILGLGRIGTEVARRAIAFGMRVFAYDPYLSLSRAQALQVEMKDLDEIFAEADFITVHMPMSDETRGMINRAAFQKMKQGVRILNCARGGIVNESDLIEAIENGTVAGAAFDVYETEPLPEDHPFRKLDQVVMTPHLGASTEEAQDNVGIEIAETITNYLRSGTIQNAVNMPSLDAQTAALVAPYLTLGEKLGRLLSQLAPQRNDRLVITFGGKATDAPGDPISRCVLKGFLSNAGGTDVNLVNANSLATSLGLVVEQVKSNEETGYAEWLHVAAFQGKSKASAGGTFFGANMNPRIVRLNSMPVEIDPNGVLCLVSNNDRPGLIGALGSLLGKYNINIANMSMNRDAAGGKTITVLHLDSVPPPEVVEEIGNLENISSVRIANL